MTKFAKYFMTGGLAAAVDFAIFAALVNLAEWPWYIAGTISFVTATLTNYMISIKHVFASGVRFRKRDEIALTFLASAIGYALNQSVLFLLIRTGVAVLLAKIGATSSVFIWNFAARHRFIFRESRPAAKK